LPINNAISIGRMIKRLYNYRCSERDEYVALQLLQHIYCKF